ncbi:hypothetical protein DEFDS_P117 (plasmid) [Deferribacter desulfuricans SSM1]|uniref:Uncharacterized protein n=1 Tax=Deferribacter desulfuricans (strain DSM 14783 / JCM 11476 / NBRC 101012 / SSM1) TaxID=639282 RepID=D3PEU7_DEFDS|nr:hypothetical protein [Deferribacter desulfuricans]BAI81739.1 hypothetical protein DEFDS_P117 [Deferribacter desulfuricans SSM1]
MRNIMLLVAILNFMLTSISFAEQVIYYPQFAINIISKPNLYKCISQLSEIDCNQEKVKVFIKFYKDNNSQSINKIQLSTIYGNEIIKDPLIIDLFIKLLAVDTNIKITTNNNS